MNVLNHMQQARIVAVIRLSDLSNATRISRALINAGITVMEFTLTNRDSLSAIRASLAELPEFHDGRALIGAGTVNSVDDAHEAIEAGAQFIVTPTTKLPVIAACKEAGVPILPGAYTPTEIETAWEAGAAAVKVFPADILGPAYIKAVLAPLPYLRLVPTGGVNLENIRSFFNNGAFAVGVGSALLDQRAIVEQRWGDVTAHAAQYAQAITDV